MDQTTVADRVAVLQLTLQDPGHDLHIAMGMRLKAAVGLNEVVVTDHQQAVERVVAIVMRPEGKRVARGQPTRLGLEALAGTADIDCRVRHHDRSPLLDPIEKGEAEAPP